jgi:hypothetical protein
MARAKLNRFSAVSGCIDSAEFAMAREGCVIKRRKPSRKLNSPRQIAARADFARVVHCWNSMSPENVRDWDAYAACHPLVNRFGKPIYVSGYNWFLKLRPIPCNHTHPIEITLPVEIGQIACFEHGPFNVPVLWPSEYPDDATISFRVGERVGSGSASWPRLFIAAGSYEKLLCPTEYYALWTALGIHMRAYYNYVLAWRVTWPGKWTSFERVAEFQCIPGSPQTIWLRFDDANASPIVYDSSCIANQTFLGPNPNTAAHSVEGVHFRALHFDGVADHINLTPESYQPYLQEYTDFTLAIWWSPDTPISGNSKDILSNYNLATPSFRLSIRSNESGMMFCFLYGGLKYYTACTWVETDVSDWRHFAVVRNGTNLRTFRNGVLLLDTSVPSNQGRLWQADTALSIGCRRGVTSFARGAADDFHIYDRALTDAEVEALAAP